MTVHGKTSTTLSPDNVPRKLFIHMRESTWKSIDTSTNIIWHKVESACHAQFALNAIQELCVRTITRMAYSSAHVHTCASIFVYLCFIIMCFNTHFYVSPGLYEGCIMVQCWATKCTLCSAYTLRWFERQVPLSALAPQLRLALAHYLCNLWAKHIHFGEPKIGLVSNYTHLVLNIYRTFSLTKNRSSWIAGIKKSV